MDSIAKDNQIAGLSQSLTQKLIRTSVLEADGVNNTLYIALLEADLTPLRSDVASDVVWIITDRVTVLESNVSSLVLEIDANTSGRRW